MNPRRLALSGGILGPGAFVAAWSILGTRIDGYSPVSQAISEIARVGRSTKPEMTAGFLAFSIGVAAFSWGIRKRHPKAAVLTTIAAVGTAGVAAFPLGQADTAHFATASAVYVSLSLLPIASGNLKSPVALAISTAIAGTLITSFVGPESIHGAMQRTGLTLADMWIAAMALKELRKR